MVASKGRGAVGIRILDESKASKNVDRHFKGQGSECRMAASFASRDKISRDPAGKVSLPRRPVLVNSFTKSSAQSNLENWKAGMRSGRKALADIGNLNNRRSQQCTNQLSNKPKLILRKDKSEVSKNVSLEVIPKSSALIPGRLKLPVRRRTVCEIHISKENQIDFPHIDSKVSKLKVGKLPTTSLEVEFQKVAKIAATTRKPAESTSKLRRATMIRHASNTKKFEASRNSGSKELEELGTSNCSNDIVNNTFISGCKSNRRKSYTLSLVIRRSCDGPVKNDLLANIDDISNPLEVADYVDDIYQYYWTMEIERPCLANFMDIQSDITPKMRSILVDWLIEVHHKYQLMEESLFLMIELLDRLLSIVNIKKKELQLFGLTTLLLASKYEDYWHPKVDELINLSVNQYTKEDMLGMEVSILKKLGFRLNVPTPFVFMLRFLRAAQSDKKLEDLAFYLIELSLVESEYLKYKASLLSASAIFVARSNLKLSPPWTGLLRKYSHYEESQLRVCADMILRFQRAAACCKPLKYTYNKYMKPDRSCVASIKPINMLPP